MEGKRIGIVVGRASGSQATGPFKMQFVKQSQAPFITFSWVDSGSWEDLSGRELYYSFSLVNDDASEEINIPISFAVRYDM